MIQDLFFPQGVTYCRPGKERARQTPVNRHAVGLREDKAIAYQHIGKVGAAEKRVSGNPVAVGQEVSAQSQQSEDYGRAYVAYFQQGQEKIKIGQNQDARFEDLPGQFRLQGKFQHVDPLE
ncbi:MAG: hypothetical protein LBQ63_00095 [Deltaproteobacteria bacterium]|nr:hypothetical protein [Deltaproteobacteria bacterium]